MNKFRVGDLVMIKEIYRDASVDWKPKLITAVYEDDDGYYWYRLHTGSIHPVAHHWAQEFELELASSNKEER